jgi:hypothetical protein
MLSREATKTNCIVFGLTQPGLEHTNYHIQGKHAKKKKNYTTYFFKSLLQKTVFQQAYVINFSLSILINKTTKKFPSTDSIKTCTHC